MIRTTLATAMTAATPALLAWALVPAALMGQEVVRIPSAPTCPKCRIELEHVVMLGGGPEDSVDVGRPLRRNSRGEYFAPSRWVPYQVAVFSATGKLLKVFGRSGEGPGDYGSVAFLEIGRGDTLHVFDAIFLRRHTLLAPGSWKVGRIAPIPVSPFLEREGTVMGPQGYVLLPDGRYIVNGARGDSALHLVGVHGELVRSFGVGYREEDPPPPPSKRHLSVLEPGEAAGHRRVDVIRRQLASAGEGRIWAAYTNRYEIELWDTAGHRLRRLARETEWFKPWRSDEIYATYKRHLLRERERPGEDAPPRPSPPGLLGLEQDDQGRIWVLLAGGNAPGAPPGNDAAGPIVEVLDPRAGRLVVSVRLGQRVRGFVGPGLVEVRETRESDGVEIVKVFRMVLVEG